MPENLGEDFQGILKALAILVAVFGCFAVLIGFIGPQVVEQLVGG